MKTNKHNTAVICLSQHTGGMELAATKLAKVLRQFINITYIIKENTFIHNECLNNPDYESLNFKTINFKTTILSPSIIFGVRSIIKNNNIKNVIFVGASEMKSLYFSFLGLDINLILRHGTIKSSIKKDFFHSWMYSNVSTHVAISKYMIQNVKYIVPFGKTTKITSIIPSLANNISSINKEKSKIFKILHAGRVTSGKGIDYAILACDILEKNKIEFHFNNFGPADKKYQNKLNSLLSSINYSNKIHINGFTDNIYDEYQRHDMFLFPTPDEGYGNVMMEAISHGIIVLAFDNTAISNFAEMGFHIHLVKDASLESLKDRLLYIVNNLEKERKLALENIDKAKIIFSPKREAQQYIELLK